MAIYLDYNATTPVDSEVIDSMLPYLKSFWGNPSSSHCFGDIPKRAIKKARGQLASLIHCQNDQIIFISGSTESINMAIIGGAMKMKEKGKHIITSNIEHPAVLEVCKYLQNSNGNSVTYLPVDQYGIITVDSLVSKIQKDTILISLMLANNEVGTIQDIASLAAAVKKINPEILFHSDASQAIGKIPVFVDELGIDMMSIAGHKFYAPKGIGALFTKIDLPSYIHGAGQENGQRAGTENVPYIVALGTASDIFNRSLSHHISHLTQCRDRLYNGLCSNISKIISKNEVEIPISAVMKVNGHPFNRLPNTLNLSFLSVDANKILQNLRDQLATSSGSACHSHQVSISYVLKNLGLTEEWAFGTFRLSVGIMTTFQEIDKAILLLSREIGV